MCPNARGPFCLLQLLAHAGILPHRISFPRGTKHDYLLCIAFSYHFLSKEVNKKWHLVLSIVWCSLMALLCESTARQSPLPSQVIIGMADYRHILSEQPLPSTEFTCSKEKCDDYSKTPSLQSWPGFFWLYDTSAVGAALGQQDWCANIKSHALGMGSDSARHSGHTDQRIPAALPESKTLVTHPLS